MAEADFTACVGNLTTSQVRRTASAAFAAPTDGGDATFIMNSVGNDVGVVAYYHNGSGFSPTPTNKGLEVYGALRRAPGGGTGGWAPFVFTMLQGNSVSDVGYMLGLADAEPAHIVLRKGAINGGLPDIAPGTQGVLRRSTTTYALDTWVHVRLTAVVNPGNDTVIRCRMNLGSVITPTWIEIPGMALVADDSAGVVSGSPGLTSGRGGFASYFEEATRRAGFDHIKMIAQP